jgi:hypothetical protein
VNERGKKKGTSNDGRAFQQNVWQLLVGRPLYGKGVSRQPQKRLEGLAVSHPKMKPKTKS